jgi:hypothetical protein
MITVSLMRFLAVAKNNQKKEKALRNKLNAQKYRKRTPRGRGPRSPMAALNREQRETTGAEA